MLGIGIGSKTSTGGTVVEGNAGIVFDGLVASSIGHKATCPACKKGSGPIVAVGSREIHLPAGPAARAGDYIDCGCPPGSNVLLAQGTITVGSEAMSGRGSGILTSGSNPANDSISADPGAPVRPASIQADHMDLRSELLRSTPTNMPFQPQAKPRYKWQIGTNQSTITQEATLTAQGVAEN